MASDVGRHAGTRVAQGAGDQPGFGLRMPSEGDDVGESGLLGPLDQHDEQGVVPV
jgi:hypothetical protein